MFALCHRISVEICDGWDDFGNIFLIVTLHEHRPEHYHRPYTTIRCGTNNRNAYTSREQTAYFAKVFKSDVGKAVEIIADILLNSKMDESAIERERQVILREMAEVNKNQEELVLDHLHATAFQGTSLGRTILGTEENIRSLTRADLVDYIQTQYTAPRMVVAGAGAVDHAELCGLAAQHFGQLPKAPPSGVEVAMEPAVFTGSDYRYVRSKNMWVWCFLFNFFLGSVIFHAHLLHTSSHPLPHKIATQ